MSHMTSNKPSGIGMMLATATAVKSGTTVTATVNGTTVTVQVARDLSVASGDVLAVQRFGSQWVAFARLYSAAPATPSNDTAPNPKPATVSGTLVVSPVETASWRDPGGWRTDTTDVLQGSFGGYGNHTGAAFYGNLPLSLTGATVTAATMQVKRNVGGTTTAQATTMRLVTESTRPVGVPTLTSTTAGPSLAVTQTNSAFVVPTSWAQAMVNGTAGGLAFYDAAGSPYVRFAGRGSWSPAFAMTISWTRP